MFMVLTAVITTRSHCEPARCQVAADLWTKPTDLSHKPACRQLENYISIISVLCIFHLFIKSKSHPTVRPAAVTSVGHCRDI